MNPLVRAFGSGVSETRPGATDPRLRGRTYAIPFDDVWNASLHLVEGGLRRWRLLEADDEKGVIRAEATSPVLRRVSEARIRIGLDENAQTRVDALTRPRTGKPGSGARGRRLIRAFFRSLDRRVGASPDRILDPTCKPEGTG